MRKLLLALALVAIAAMPAFASVQNIKVSGDIDSSYVYRHLFDLGSNHFSSTSSPISTADSRQSFFMTQTRLRVDADLTDNVSTTVALINERPWTTHDSGSSDGTDVDLNLAYVTLREMLYSPLTVVVGRQAFHYGNSFIVDSAGTNNSAPTDSGLSAVAVDLTKQTALDAIRMIFDYKPLTLELLFSKIDARTLVNRTDDDDIDLYGANATYELGDSMKTQVEAYFFARINKVKDNDATGSSLASKNDTTYVPGVRVSTNPIEGLNTQLEFAWQTGNKVTSTGTIRDNAKRDALGAQFIASYWIPVGEDLSKYKPMIQDVYTYVSGDSNPTDLASASQSSTQRYTAWDPMFENQGSGRIYNVLFDLTNAHINALTLGFNPLEDVNIKTSWTHMRLDKRHDGGTLTIRDADGTTNSVVLNGTAGKRGGKDIGNEFDIDTNYDYTEDVQIGASVGFFIPGDLFDAINDQTASQAIVHVNVNF